MCVKLYDLMFSLSCAMDLVAPDLYNHHQQVAYLSYRLGAEMGLNQEDLLDLLLAGIVHDVGSLSVRERLVMIREERQEIGSHAMRGAALLEKYPPFSRIAAILRYHHLAWNQGEGVAFQGDPVPMLSHVLHLADRICVLFTGNNHILLQLPQVLAQVQAREGSRFLPEAVAAMTRLATREYVWLELSDRDPMRFLSRETELLNQDLDLSQVLQIAHIFSQVIDFRSRFTATHSAGVAYTARLLGELNGMSSTECDMLLIAGYLHDLGKIAVDNDILEKAGQLTLQEYRIIRSHTFYTYRLLSGVQGMETIAEWAAYHHEKLDGSGYPFHLPEKSLPYGSRIMSVADVFSSITENRPYREGMAKEQAMKTLQSMVQSGALSRELVEMLAANYELFYQVREEAQQNARAAYEGFYGLWGGFAPHTQPQAEGQAISS